MLEIGKAFAKVFTFHSFLVDSFSLIQRLSAHCGMEVMLLQVIAEVGIRLFFLRKHSWRLICPTAGLLGFLGLMGESDQVDIDRGWKMHLFWNVTIWVLVQNISFVSLGYWFKVWWSCIELIFPFLSEVYNYLAIQFKFKLFIHLITFIKICH